MLRPINAIIKDNVGNIIHRGFVVTGEVAKDNGDGSYDVFIAGEAKEYPRVFTLARNPDLEVGDKVRILYKNGCKELPIILPPVKPTVIPRRYVLIVTGPNELQLFDMDGNLINQIAVSGWSYSGCSITMDSQGNIYVSDYGEVIRKYDSNLNLLVTKNVEDDIDGINMGSDGYLYTLELIDEGYNVKKRSTSDLIIVTSIPITTEVYYAYSGGLCLDSDGNIYVYQNPYVEKYNSSGTKIASIDVGNLSNEYAGCGVLGNYVYFVRNTDEIIYLPLNLSSYFTWNLPSGIAYGICVADGHLICSGWDGDGDGATSKYDSDRNLIWTVKLTAASYAYKAGGYNF